MNRIMVFLFIVFLIFNSKLNAQTIKLDDIFNRKFERSFISQGDNFPDFRTNKDSMQLFLIALHNNISIKDFQSKTGFNDERMKSIISLLESKNWLHKINSNYKPSIFIATKEDGQKLYEFAKPISKEIVRSIQKSLPSIRKKFSKTKISKTQDFEDWSFLILSDVLLDSWQIFNVEKQFLGADSRPNRHGKHYYASLKELTGEKEGFGIYGNQVGPISVYGNNRRNADITNTENIVFLKDDEIFNEMASNYLPNLIHVLNKEKQYSLGVYQKLGYSKEIAFEEFFIWWYHFIYSQTTELMNSEKMLAIPKDGNFVYKILDYSDETHNVTFKVKVPNKSDVVYITGNQPELGDWNPSELKMNETGDFERTINLHIHLPAQFKFTKGNWDLEAEIKGFPKGENIYIEIDKETEEFEIINWFKN